MKQTVRNFKLHPASIKAPRALRSYCTSVLTAKSLLNGIKQSKNRLLIFGSGSIWIEGNLLDYILAKSAKKSAIVSKDKFYMYKQLFIILFSENATHTVTKYENHC